MHVRWSLLSYIKCPLGRTLWGFVDWLQGVNPDCWFGYSNVSMSNCQCCSLHFSWPVIWRMCKRWPLYVLSSDIKFQMFLLNSDLYIFHDQWSKPGVIGQYIDVHIFMISDQSNMLVVNKLRWFLLMTGRFLCSCSFYVGKDCNKSLRRSGVEIHK